MAIVQLGLINKAVSGKMQFVHWAVDLSTAFNGIYLCGSLS